VLRVVAEDGHSVGDLVGVFSFLLLESIFQLLESAALKELLMAEGFSECFVAGDDVPFDDLLQAFELFFQAYLQLASDGGSDGLVGLLDIDVHEAVGVEEPGESNVVLAVRGGSEHEVPDLSLGLEFAHGCSRRDVLESGMDDPSGGVSALVLDSLLYLEVVVPEVFFRGLEILLLLVQVLLVTLQVFLPALESDVVLLVSQTLDLIDPALEHMTDLDGIGDLVLSIGANQVSCVDDSIESVVELAEHSVFQDSDYGGCDDDASLEGLL
jgi:hypothetical protein